MDTLETYNEIFNARNLNINDGIDKCFIEKIENRKKDFFLINSLKHNCSIKYFKNHFYYSLVFYSYNSLIIL